MIIVKIIEKVIFPYNKEGIEYSNLLYNNLKQGGFKPRRDVDTTTIAITSENISSLGREDKK